MNGNTSKQGKLKIGIGDIIISGGLLLLLFVVYVLMF